MQFRNHFNDYRMIKKSMQSCVLVLDCGYNINYYGHFKLIICTIESKQYTEQCEESKLKLQFCWDELKIRNRFCLLGIQERKPVV